jgi:hypothetical protein
MTDFRALCAEIVQLENEQQPDYADWKRRWNAVISRARAALAQPEPEGEVSDEELHDAFYRHSFEGFGQRLMTWQEFHAGVRAAIALDRRRRAPVHAAEGEVAELVADLRSTASGLESQSYPQTAALITRAATLLQHLQPPHPVAVSERPWERDGWVNGDDECWIGYPSTTYAIADTGDYDTTACEWRLEAPPSRPEVSNCVALPFHALPIPTTPPEAP